MPHHLALLSDPVVLEQYDYQQRALPPQKFFTGDNAPDFTGMVLCPQRGSHIGVMRCAEYQRERGCGLRCPNAATKENIELVAVNSRQEIDEPVLPGTCRVCGGPVKTKGYKRCSKCRNRLNGSLGGRRAHRRGKS